MKRLETEGLAADLDHVTSDRTGALSTVLDSFFCRAHSGARERVIEFTHKSFSEFLAARRIVREIADLAADLDRPASRRHTDAALRAWMDLCGPAAVDKDLMEMIQAEVAAPPQPGAPEKDIALWRRTFTALFQKAVDQGMPWPGDANERARAAERRVRNAEVALLVALNATVQPGAAKDDRLLTIDWSITPAIDTLYRLIGPTQSKTTAHLALGRLDLSGANLSGADLSGANLKGANLTEANLSEANLSGANLTEAKMDEANLSRAKLNSANLSRAKLTEANLHEANLSKAVLIWANLSRANFGGADLTKADLSGANLCGGNLRGANFGEACLNEAKLSRAILFGANLYGANLNETDLTRANLFGADLSRAILTDANLTEADLSGANLTEADLGEANLLGANLSGAKGL